MNTRRLALSIVSAALYVAVGFTFQSLAFGIVNIRFADALYPLIAILGLPWLVGTFAGHVIFNCYGFAVGLALGPWDLLTPFVLLIPKLLIWKFGLKMVPVHVWAVATYVSLLLTSFYGGAFELYFVGAFIGEAIAEIGLGVPLTLAIKKILGGQK